MLKTNKMRKLKIGFGAIALLFLLCMFTGVGCVNITKREYQQFVQELDDKSELSVSTHPAWFGKEKVKIPYLYIKMVTDDYVALQFHLREHGKKIGKNPHLQSIQVHKFSYRLDNGPEKILLTDYSKASWGQDTGNYKERTTKGIPYQKGSILHFSAELTLNGEDFSVKGQMPAQEKTTLAPIFFYYLGR